MEENKRITLADIVDGNSKEIEVASAIPIELMVKTAGETVKQCLYEDENNLTRVDETALYLLEPIGFITLFTNIDVGSELYSAYDVIMNTDLKDILNVDAYQKFKDICEFKKKDIEIDNSLEAIVSKGISKAIATLTDGMDSLEEIAKKVDLPTLLNTITPLLKAK